MIILAALRSVPRELYESASIDGANAAQSFVHITVPSIKRVLEVLMLLTIVWSFQRFTILYLLTGGGPAGSTETAVVRIYRTAFEYFDPSYAYTMGTIVLLLLLIITGVFLWVTRSKEEGGMAR
jgi:multiple sugar transport system permease protein